MYRESRFDVCWIRLRQSFGETTKPRQAEALAKDGCHARLRSSNYAWLAMTSLRGVYDEAQSRNFHARWV